MNGITEKQAKKLYDKPFDGHTGAFPTSRLLPDNFPGEEWQDYHGDVAVIYYFEPQETEGLDPEDYPWDFEHVMKIGKVLDDDCIEWVYSPYWGFQ